MAKKNKKRDLLSRIFGRKETGEVLPTAPAVDTGSQRKQALNLKVGGELDAEIELLNEKELSFRESGDWSGLISNLLALVMILRENGKLTAALELVLKSKLLCLEHKSIDGLAKSLAYEAMIRESGGETDGAMKLYKEAEVICRKAEEICRELGDKRRELDYKHQLGATLSSQAMLLAAKGQLHKALPLAEEAYRLFNDHGPAMAAQALKPILEGWRKKLG